MVPINTVERDGFGKMIHTLDKRYSIPSTTHNYFSSVALPAMYKKNVFVRKKNHGRES